MNVITLTLGPLATNCYILYGNDRRAAVIDPAFSSDRIGAVLGENGLTLDKILLTHAHFDHIMAAEELRGNGVSLCLHCDDEEMLYNSILNCMHDFCGRSMTFAKAERLFADGDTVDIGGEALTVMHTPGHTKGSVCYISDKFIFSGDTLFKDGVGRCDLYGGSFQTLCQSLYRLKSLEKDYVVYPGHGGQTTLEYEKNNNLYMKTLR